MRLIDADTALDGLTITARKQLAGKGQRGRQWEGGESQSLMMSIIVKPRFGIDDQFLLCAIAALSVIDTLEYMQVDEDLKIKWTNDIIINDKKAGGILIENVLRGDAWSYTVIGIGINVLQDQLALHLPYATSLKISAARDFDIAMLRDEIRYNIFRHLEGSIDADELIGRYNDYLFRKDALQDFSDGSTSWKAEVKQVMKDGKLKVREMSGEETFYTHGVINWQWR
mgnify:CR=1 FL=1